MAGSSPRLAGASRTGARSAPRFHLFPLIAVTVCVAILLGLGTWQVQRLAWKTALLAKIAALQSAPPEPLDVVLNRLGKPGQPAQGEVDFVRVQATCPTLQQTPTLHLYALLDGVLGDRLITACPLPGGRYSTLLVDRGFVDREHLDEVSPGPALDGPIVGVLRRPEPATWLSLPNTAARNDWHTRDIPAMAAALNAPAPAPVVLMLERPAAPPPGPRPAAIPTDIPNNHLGYALTWFGLAAGLAGVYVAKLRRPRRA
ncbi:SURF1 family protein [Caulobacter sp. S45]|uniref:SURF1 family protein n=1 Tax=Caulobacter sp. S45 TaxID=1641861 RepID=UPI001576261C|nr:SURF1 family protein [Caulobacter sp. S45]